MHFYFADQEVSVKQPAREFWQRQLIVKTGPLMVRPAINATPAFLLMRVLL